MIGHLNVDVIRRNEILAGPALFDDLNEFVGDVDTPFVGPSSLEPLRQFRRGNLPLDIDVLIDEAYAESLGLGALRPLSVAGSALQYFGEYDEGD